MTWLDSEKSNYGGAPRMLYNIELNGGDVAAYYYTDFRTDLSVLGNTYVAAPARLSNISIRNPADMRPVTLTLPQDASTFAVARELAIDQPPRSATLEVRRYHGNIAEVQLMWVGIIRRARLQNRQLVIESQHVLSAALETEVSTASWQAACNHQLYSAECTVARGSFQTNTTVSAIDATNPRLVTIASFGGATPGDHVAGEIVRVSDGERRTIVGVSGTQLTLLRSFRNLSVSDSVEVYEGCPHTIAACNTQFSNLVNNGGFPYVTPVDLFRFGIQGARY